MDVLDATLLDSWADEEFGDANLGDQRLNRRLVALARTLARRPASSLPQAAQAPALLNAASRFFDHDDGAFPPDDILASHVIAPYDRLSTVPLALALSDTTFLDWSSHPATIGLGPLETANMRAWYCTPPCGSGRNGSRWGCSSCTCGRGMLSATAPIRHNMTEPWTTKRASNG